MGWFGLGGKDWNVIAIIFEKADLYRVAGQRGKGSLATTVRDNVKTHGRTIHFAVYDQSRAMLESGPGGGERCVPQQAVQRLTRELHTNATVQQVLAILETGKEDKVSKPLVWNGYPNMQERTGIPGMQ